MRKLLAFVLLASGLTTGCDIFGLGDSLTSKLRGEKRAWLRQRITDYSYEYHVACFCPPADTLVVVVRNNVVTNVINKSTGQEAALYVVYTMPQLYDFLIDSARRADEMTADFDERLHIPTRVNIDYERNTADEELAITAGNLLVSESLQQKSAANLPALPR